MSRDREEHERGERRAEWARRKIIANRKAFWALVALLVIAAASLIVLR